MAKDIDYCLSKGCDIVNVTVNSEEATCKRLQKYLELISNNASSQSMFFSNRGQNKPVKIIGEAPTKGKKHECY